MEKIGTSIKLIRESKKLKQLDIAIQLGIEQSTYAKIENNQIKLSVDRLIKIARILDIPISSFFRSAASKANFYTDGLDMNIVAKILKDQTALIAQQHDFLEKILRLLNEK